MAARVVRRRMAASSGVSRTGSDCTGPVNNFSSVKTAPFAPEKPEAPDFMVLAVVSGDTPLHQL